MNFKLLLVLLTFLLWLSSCAKTGSTKSNLDRTENTQQVKKGSPEMVNVELGVGYLKRGKEGDLEVALEKFKKAISYNSKFALAHSMLANVYDKKGLFESASKHYKLSMKHNNNNPDIINNYANFLCQRGSYDLAIEKYLNVVDNPQYKTPASAYENAGVCSVRDNKIDKAEGFFRSALELNKKQPNALYQLMQINLNKKQYFKALAFLQRLEQVVQPSSEMLAAGYQIEKGLNRDDLAKKYLTKLKKNFPSSTSLKTINE
ncbi:MAG: type IV pilus biogenesis/stability protein PilW [Proteobacteria bacterium]|nr:type IV pilus biogenesis/stability protein PilW [Pseudomonadota bacterium]